MLRNVYWPELKWVPRNVPASVFYGIFLKPFSFPSQLAFSRASLPLPQFNWTNPSWMPISCQVVLGFGDSVINKIHFKFSTPKRSERALLTRLSLAGKRKSRLCDLLCDPVILPPCASFSPERKAWLRIKSIIDVYVLNSIFPFA